MKLLENIDKDRGKHIKRGTWMKEAAEFYLKYKGKPAVRAEPIIQPELNSEDIDEFLDGID